MKKSELVGGFFWFILGIILCIESIRLDLGAFGFPGPGFMPFLLGVFIGLLGLIHMFTFILNRLGEEKELNAEKIWMKENLKRVPFISLTIIGYALLLELLGFLLTTFIFLFFLFKFNEPRKWVMPLVMSGVTAILSYFVFLVFLKCPFPRGIFRF